MIDIIKEQYDNAIMICLYVFDLDVVLNRSGSGAVGVGEMIEALHSCGHRVTVVADLPVDTIRGYLEKAGLLRYVHDCVTRSDSYRILRSDVGIGTFKEVLNATVSFKTG